MIPKEFMGKARAFHRAVVTIEAGLIPALTRLYGPVQVRLSKKPTLRPNHLIDMRREWERTVTPRFRIGLQQDRTSLQEIRLSTAKGRDDPSWDHWEDRVVVCRYGILLNSRKRQFETGIFNHEVLASASLHAISRWFQRAGGASEEELVNDLAQIATLNETMEGSQFRVPTAVGEWRGAFSDVSNKATKLIDSVAEARTWIHDDSIAE